MDRKQGTQNQKHAETYRRLSLRIAYYRKLAGLSQVALAEKVGISRQHMSSIESPGMVWPFTTTVLFDIAEALGVDVMQLFDFR